MADVHHPNKPVRQCEARRLADMQGKSYAARTAIIRLSYMGGSCVFIVVREQGLEVVVGGRTKTFNIYFKDKDQEVCRLTLHRTPSSVPLRCLRHQTPSNAQSALFQPLHFHSGLDDVIEYGQDSRERGRGRD